VAFDLSPSNFGAIGSGVGGVLSLGGSIYGAIAGSEQAGKINQDYNQIMQTQMQENALRRTTMELQTRRQQTQNIRQAQYARSMALTTATNQGAAYGESSGLRGAYGSISGQASTNQLQLSQNLQSSEQMFNLNDILSAEQKNLASDQAGMQSIQGMTNMFGSIGKSLGSIGSLASLAFAV
jgi:hypothetical protein